MERDLAKELFSLSGLSKEYFELHFGAMLERHNVSSEGLTLETLREILASEIQDLLIEMKNSEQ